MAMLHTWCHLDAIPVNRFIEPKIKCEVKHYWNVSTLKRSYLRHLEEHCVPTTTACCKGYSLNAKLTEMYSIQPSPFYKCNRHALKLNEEREYLCTVWKDCEEH